MTQRQQFALRLPERHTKRRVLMTRYADENGKGGHGQEAPWEDIATFDEFERAEQVINALRESAR